MGNYICHYPAPFNSTCFYREVEEGGDRWNNAIDLSILPDIRSGPAAFLVYQWNAIVLLFHGLFREIQVASQKLLIESCFHLRCWKSSVSI